MNSYTDNLKKTAREKKSLVCFGLDPVLERIPVQESRISETISSFFKQIFDEFDRSDVWPSCVKPNFAFYAQYGFEGLRALGDVCEMSKSAHLPIILDAKRGDIGKTSEAYAKEAFEAWEADAVTVSPYMGTDSVKPFVDMAKRLGKAVYVLARTSNEGAKDFQELKWNETPLYQVVAEKIAAWGESCPGTVGAVIGATAPNELSRLHRLFVSSKSMTPYLIPGVGSQGGSAKEVVKILKEDEASLGIHRINSSSGISYAYEKSPQNHFAKAATEALKTLNEEIGYE